MHPDVLLLLCFAFGGVCMDIFCGKVFNAWILLGWLTGALFQVLKFGPAGILRFFAGALLPMGLLLMLFLFHMMGAGDIKLLSVLCGILGTSGGLRCIACTFLTGAVLSAFILLQCGNLRERLQYFFRYLAEFAETGRRKPYLRKGERMENFPFTIPIFLAAVFYAGGFY